LFFEKCVTAAFSREPLLFLTVSPIRFYLRFSNDLIAIFKHDVGFYIDVSMDMSNRVVSFVWRTQKPTGKGIEREKIYEFEVPHESVMKWFGVTDKEEEELEEVEEEEVVSGGEGGVKVKEEPVAETSEVEVSETESESEDEEESAEAGTADEPITFD